MRTNLLVAALVLAAGPVASASPPQPWEPPRVIPEGTGYCSVFVYGTGIDTCTYYSATPLGELGLGEYGSNATLTVRCSQGAGSLTEPGTTVIVHGGKCLVRLESTGTGVADGYFRSVVTK